MMNLKDAARLSSLDAWSRYGLPYAFKRLSTVGGHVWLPLNRDYKPIGQDGEDFASGPVRFAVDPTTLRGIWHGSVEGQTLYLYDDAPESRVDYFARLERLFSYTLKTVESSR